MYKPITVLMWKHSIVRMRRYLQTPLELLSTVILLILMFSFKNKIVGISPLLHEHLGEVNIRRTDALIIDEIIGPTVIAYAPDTNYTLQLMDQVGKDLHLERLEGLSESSITGYYGFRDIASAEDYLMDMSESNAVVIFHNNVDSLPDRLNYTIRMKVDYRTETYMSLDGMITAHMRFGTMYESFYRLQWAIDKSYIQMRTGRPINQMLVVQEFPFVEANQNPMAVAVAELVIITCFFGLFLPFVFLMSRLLEERATGVQELIKMAGISSTTLTLSHVLNVAPTGLLFCIVTTILLKVTAVPFIPHSDGFLIFIFLVLYFLSVITLAFVCSFFVRQTLYVTTLSISAYMLSWLPANLLSSVTMPRAVLLLTGFLPHAPLYWFWRGMAELEKYGLGASWSNMARPQGERSGSVLECYIFLLAQIALYGALAAYLSVVLPGKYGTPRPWNFAWKKKVKPEQLLDSQEEPMVRETNFFEDPPTSKDVGIKICNVSKVFGKERVLHDVTFDVYHGEITVLLGHNGAGKTTLMSIITGMLGATDGQVYVNGIDAMAHQLEVRKQIGLCTQHNLFIPDLTVQEHVVFFSLLRGRTCEEARSSAKELLQELGIMNKANSRSTELSGGMKRRLQLACALAGGCNVLILDEPTSGLDVETRRELWDLLLSMRGKRTVLLTTHFMEEADALGDRVAALHQGLLRCHATPMHLKKNIGSGYRLSLTTIGIPREAEITAAVTSEIPDATVRQVSLNYLAYGLPSAAAPRFAGLFRTLEGRRSELGIDSIGVGMPTLEEVFLRLCSNVDTSFAEDEVDSSIPEPTYKKLTGFRLHIRQISTLLMRNVHFIISTKFAFMALHLLPLLFIFVFTYIMNLDFMEVVENPDVLTMDLDMYRDMPDVKVLYNVDDDEAFARVMARYPHVTFVETTDLQSAILQTGRKSMKEYVNYIAGVELNSSDARVMFTTVYRHAAPVALNLLTNLLAAREIPSADGGAIATSNQPPGSARAVRDEYTLIEPKNMITIVSWVAVVSIMYMSTIMNAVALPCKELAAGTRHIHIMSGCSPALHWLTRLLFHTTLYSVLVGVPIIIALLIFERSPTLNQPAPLGVFFLVFILGAMAWLALIYLISFRMTERGVSMVLSLLLILGLITAVIQSLSVLMNMSISRGWEVVFYITLFVLPSHAVTSAMLKAGNVARLNAFCELNRDTCPPTLHSVDGLDVHACCVLKQQPARYFDFNSQSPGIEILIICGQFIVYMTLVLLSENGVFDNLFDKLFNSRYREPAARYDDQMVRAEKTYVQKAITLPNKQVPDAMLVDNVHKNYFKLLKKSCNSLKGVSFSVKKGECFGVLGVNGAGKSTTFKTIVGETSATRGSIFANGRHLKFPRHEYLRRLGYCPQFFGLDEFLSGAQNLALLLTLRGLQPSDVATEVDAWVQVVGLEQYRDQRVKEYSGGCKRRMATAAALSSGAPLTLLDEPTSGVDVSARRRVWAALRRGLRQHRAVIITSHSMDEMEALCDRIAIMSAGEVCALGSPGALRAAHAAGHAVLLKLSAAQARPGADETDGASQVTGLKADMQGKFNCKLKDEHKTMLHYHINETMQYSELFARLEELKRTHSALVEDYTVTETTLEEVFLSFAHADDEPSGHLAV